MSEIRRYRVHTALNVLVETMDDTLDPVAYVEATIQQMAIAAGYTVTQVGQTSSMLVYKAGDHVEWTRAMPDGDAHSEYGMVVDAGGALMIQFADGQSVPLPSRLAA